jgi:ubiquinone/menaquinone biosynthesis C-methylase UbiE
MKNALVEETHWEKAAKTKMGKYLTEIEADFVSEKIDLEKLKLVMDVGAEAGRFSIFAANKNVEVVGIDIDSYGLKRLRLKNKQVVLVQADARYIPLKDDLLDAIFMIEVLDYIPELETALAECLRTLKSEGSLILSFGNDSSLKSKLRRLRGKSYMHSYREITRTLKKVDFRTTKKAGYNWLPFGRTSENRLIPLLARIEGLFGLRRFPRFSPWVIIHAVKSG